MRAALHRWINHLQALYRDCQVIYREQYQRLCFHAATGLYPAHLIEVGDHFVYWPQGKAMPLLTFQEVLKPGVVERFITYLQWSEQPQYVIRALREQAEEALATMPAEEQPDSVEQRFLDALHIAHLIA